MHILIAMRGIKHAVDSVVEELSKIMLTMWVKLPQTPENLSGADFSKGGLNMVQVAVRPSLCGLYEIVFPREFEDLMCATLFHGQVPKCNEEWMIKWLWLLRKLIHLEPINWDYRKEPYIHIPKKEFVEVIGIGKKSDSYIKTETEEHENL